MNKSKLLKSEEIKLCQNDADSDADTDIGNSAPDEYQEPYQEGDTTNPDDDSQPEDIPDVPDDSGTE